MQGPQHATLIVDPTIRVVHASPGAAEIFGVADASELVGTDGFALLAGDEGERGRSMAQRFLTKLLPGERGPWQLRRRDGSTFMAEVEVTRLEPPGGTLNLVLSVMDTSQQRHTARALDRALEWTDHLLDISGTMIVSLDAKGRIRSINVEGCRILGYRREQLLGRDWIETCVPQRIREEVRGVATKLYAGTVEPVEHYENPVLTASGEERTIYWHNTITRDEDGGVFEILSSGLDITDRVEAERRHRVIFERAANPIARLALDGTILDSNPQTQRVFGYSAEELRGKHTSLLIHPDDHQRMAVDLGDIRELGTYYQRQYRALHRDGRTIDIEVDVTLIPDAQGGQELICQVADVSARVRSDRLERLSNRLLRIFHEQQSPESLADSFCQELRESTGCAAVAVRRLDPDGTAPWLANHGFPDELAIAPGALAEGETCGFATMVTVPIRFREEQIGLVQAASTEPQGVPRDVLTILEESALQLGIALQRLHAERELQEQLTFQQELLDAIPIPVYYKDERGRMMGWNRAWLRATGWRPSEVAGRQAQEVLPEHLAELFDQKDRELLERPGRQAFEHSMTAANGQRMDTVMHRATFSRGGDQVGGIIGAMVDITALKQATAALEDLNRDLEAKVLEQLGELQTLYRLSRELAYARSLPELGRAALHHLQGPVGADLCVMAVRRGDSSDVYLRSTRPLAPRAIADLEQCLGSALARLGINPPEPGYAEDLEGQPADGVQARVEALGSCYVVPLQVEGQGLQIGVLLAAAEREEALTENHVRLLHVASTQITEAAQRLLQPHGADGAATASPSTAGPRPAAPELPGVRTLLDRLPQLGFLLDGAQRVVHANRAAVEQLSLQDVDLEGRTLGHCPIRWEWNRIEPMLLPRALRAGPARLPDLRTTHPDGHMGVLDLWLLPLDSPSGEQCTLLLAEDVTLRREGEGRLHQARKMQSIGQLAAGIAHEINTPTQYVGDNLQFLGESFEDLRGLLTLVRSLLHSPEFAALPEPMRETLDDAVERADLDYQLEEIPSAIQQASDGVRRIGDIVRAMREFSHGGGREKSVADVNRCVESTVTVSRNEWKYVAEVELDLDPDLPSIPTLAAELNQVLLNLLVNAAHAIAATGSGDERGLGAITIRTRRSEAGVEIAVEDNGCGIPLALQPRIFEPFFTTKPVGMGTGQGLAISRTIVLDKLGGHLEFVSTPGLGSTFVIQLPLTD